MAPSLLARAAAGLALAAALGAPAVRAQDTPEICIGRAPGACDVISAGQVQALYSAAAANGNADAEPTLEVIGASDDTVAFYVTTAKAPLAKPVNFLAVEAEKIAQPKVSSNFTKTGLAVGEVGLAEVTFNCLEKGDTKVSFVVKAPKSKTTARFAVIKTCAGVQKSQDDVKAAGLDVATLQGTAQQGAEGKAIETANVVVDGAAADEFALGGDLAYKGLAAVPDKDIFTEFYLGAHKGTPKVTFGQIVVLSESSVCRPVLSGSAAMGGTVEEGSPALDLTLTYNCRTAGTTPVTVRIPVEEPAPATITFSVKKTCAEPEGEPGKVAVVNREVVSVPGLTLETGNTYSPQVIARDGIVLPAFTQEGDKAGAERQGFDATPANMIAAGRKAFTFTARMEAGGDGAAAQGVDDPIIFVEDPDIVSARIDEAVTSITQEPTELRVKFRCFKTGASKVTVSLPLSPPVGEVMFSLIKVCNPSAAAADENKKDQLTDELEAPKLPIDISLEPKGAAAVVKNGKTQETFLARKIATRFSPAVGSAVEGLSSWASGAGLADKCAACLPKEATLGMTFAGLKQAVVQCNITDACAVKEYQGAMGAVRATVAKAFAEASGPAVFEPGVFSADMYVSVHPGNSDVQIGAAEVVSFDERVCVPKLQGPASSAGTITGTPAKITTTFNCAGYGGSALVVVKIPVFGGKKQGMISYAMLKQCAQVNATEFGGTASDDSEMATELENVIAHSGAGVNIGTGSSGDELIDVVENGLVMPEFLPASNADNGDAGGYLVPADRSSLTLHFSSADGPDAEPVSVGIPQVVSFNPRIAKVSVDETSGLHRSKSQRAKFKLYDPLELLVSFTCINPGTAVIGVAVPLGPRGGGITFEFAKECKDEKEAKDFTGDVVPGLQVGTAQGGADVVKDGQTARLWTRYKRVLGPGSRKMIEPSTRSVDFFLSMDPEAKENIEFGTPIVLSHKPICSPTVEGPGASAGTATQAGVQLTVRFNCVWEGQSPVTVMVPLSKYKENGHLIWTFTKRCSTQQSDTPLDAQIPLDDATFVDHDNDGIVGPEHEPWMDWNPDMDYLDYYQDYFGDEGFYNYYYYDYAPWTTEWEPEEWDDKMGDEYWWYEDEYYYSYEDGGYFEDAWGLDYEYSAAGDALTATLFQRGLENESKLSIGTHPGRADVVDGGVALPRYKMCEPVEGVPCTLMAMVSQDTATFYISSTDFETLGLPRVYAKYERSVAVEIVNAKALEGKVVEPGSAVQVDLRFTCLKQGITSPILVTVSYGFGLHHADFSVLKVCGKKYSTAAVAIETTTVLIGIGVVLSMILSFLAGRRLKKLKEGRDLSD